MSEMLEYFSVFICDRDPHGFYSFLHNILMKFNR